MEETKLTDFIDHQPTAPLYPDLSNEIEKIKEGEKLYLLKSMISQNRDMSKVILKNLEQPIKTIDISLSSFVKIKLIFLGNFFCFNCSIFFYSNLFIDYFWKVEFL